MSTAEPYQAAIPQAPLVPARPTPIPGSKSAVRRLLAIRKSGGIAVWGERAYREDVLQSRLLGRNSFIFNNPDAIRHVLVDNHDNYVRNPPAIRLLQPILGDGLIMAEGRAWKHQRRTIAPALTPRAVTSLIPHMRDVIDEAVAQLDDLRASPVDLREAMLRMSLEAASRTMFSFGMAEHGPAMRALVHEYASRLARVHLLDVLLPLSWPSPQDIARMFFRRRWTNFMRSVVAERRAANREDQGPRDLFDLLIAARDPETSEAFTDDNLVDQVSNIIMAGHETTATALFWSLFLLAQDSASQEEVAREARATADLDLGALKFTRAVLDETMRLYPPSFIISRSAAGSDMVNGNSVKKGDVIVVSPWLLHRHHSFWSNPHAFMPERFMSQKAPERFTYLPFGVGPRVCVGANFALTEATLALAKIVAHFRIELLGTRPVIPIGLITTRPDHSPMFRLTRR